MQEIWKDIPGFEGHYQASNLGKLRSLDRSHFFTTRHKTKGFRKIKGREIRPKFCAANGYWMISLSKGGKIYYNTLHKVVALTFLIKPEGKYEINHKDGVKINNHIENLEWVTSSENRKHAFKMGLQDKTIAAAKARCGMKASNVRFNNSQIKKIREENKNGLSLRKLAIKYKCGKSTIFGIVKRQTWRHIIP